MKSVTRREFIRTTSIVAAALPTISSSGATAADNPAPQARMASGNGHPTLSWVDGSTPPAQPGVAFGVPWPRGKHPSGTRFTMRTASGKQIPLQTWTTATWPDGSLKWTGHSIAPDAPLADSYEILPGDPARPVNAIQLSEGSDQVVIQTGVITCTVNRQGEALIESIARDSRNILRNGRLIGMRQDSPERGV
ncbi:MAG TPA: hypothetical protein VK995_06065, partial [Oceanipulchritudo sp.]|nr:hypothetical protein [Oceanipulchritudo sp.]